jgi:uncharacterized membrane protein
MRTTVRTTRRTSVSFGCFGSVLIGLFVVAAVAYAVEVAAVIIAAAVVVLAIAAVVQAVKRRHGQT